MRETLRQFRGLIEPGQRRQWWIAIGFAFVVSIVESMSALLVYFLMSTVIRTDRAITVPGLGELHERYPNASDGELFSVLAVVLGSFFVLRSALGIIQSHRQHQLVYGSGALLSARLLRSYLARPYAWHLRRSSSELIRTANDSVLVIVSNVFVPIVSIGSESLIVLGIVVILIIKAPVASIVALAVFAPALVLLFRTLQHRMVRQGQVNEEMGEQSIQVLQQSAGAIREITLLGSEEHFTRRLDAARAVQARALGLRSTIFDIPRSVVETMAIVFILVFLAVTRLRDSGVESSLATLGLFAYAVLRVLPSLQRIITHMNLLRFGSAAMENVIAELADESAAPDLSARGAQGGQPRLELLDRLVVAGMSYRYDGASADAVHDVDLVIEAGQSVGLVGPTGGGKTTLVDLICGLLVPTSGAITVDGVDIASVLDGWRQNLGVVPQTPFLLDDTLRRNIAFGLEDDEIDDVAVRDAVRLAQLDAFIAQLPDGLDTEVGERGVRVSGGQRQRVAIARALYRQPKVLVFDEGTAALDNITEADLIAALEKLRGDRTLITIAHRLTTVRDCDVIVLLQAGSVVDTGTYDDLLARSAEFRHLVG